MLYIDEILFDSNNQIILIGPNGESLMGYIDTELVFGASANWDSNASSDSINSLQNNFKKVASQLGSSTSINTQSLSKLNWLGSKVDGFTFNILMVATTKGSNLLEDAKQIYEFLLPQTVSKLKLKAPMGYSASISDKKTKNPITIYIGDWFEGTGWLMDNANFTVSKEKIDGDGRDPLYVNVTCSLIPSYDFHKEDILKMFK